MAERPADAATPPVRDRRLAVLLAATLATCLLGWLFKANCTFDGAWSGSEQYTTGCYSDAVPFWHGREIAAGKLPYLQARMEYPVLTGALIFIEGRVTALLFGARAGSADFLFVVTAVNAALALLVTRLLWAMRVAPARLWWWALAPPLILYVGHNWDMLAVALAIGALVLAQRDRPVAAAMLAALGGAAKLFPLFLPPLLAWRALLARRGWLVASIAMVALAAWLAVNLPVAVLAAKNWSEFYRFSSERGGTAASVWEAGQSVWLAEQHHRAAQSLVGNIVPRGRGGDRAHRPAPPPRRALGVVHARRDLVPAGQQGLFAAVRLVDLSADAAHRAPDRAGRAVRDRRRDGLFRGILDVRRRGRGMAGDGPAGDPRRGGGARRRAAVADSQRDHGTRAALDLARRRRALDGLGTDRHLA